MVPYVLPCFNFHRFAVALTQEQQRTLSELVRDLQHLVHGLHPIAACLDASVSSSTADGAPEAGGPSLAHPPGTNNQQQHLVGTLSWHHAAQPWGIEPQHAGHQPAAA
jgi:hypothetical protein